LLAACCLLPVPGVWFSNHAITQFPDYRLPTADCRLNILPGDTLVIPVKLDHGVFMRGIKD
jgi:hypothetical protein